jgi:hypothetical protein
MSYFEFGVLAILIIAVVAQFQPSMRKLRDIEDRLGAILRKLEN